MYRGFVFNELFTKFVKIWYFTFTSISFIVSSVWHTNTSFHWKVELRCKNKKSNKNALAHSTAGEILKIQVFIDRSMFLWSQCNVQINVMKRSLKGFQHFRDVVKCQQIVKPIGSSRQISGQGSGGEWAKAELDL